MWIDIKTAYFLLGLLYVVMPLSTFLYLKSHRSKAIDLWCFGGFLNGIGLIMISFRPLMLGHYPDFITFTLVNVLMISGYTLRVQSFKLDMKRPMTKFLIMAIIIVFALGYQLCVTLSTSLGPRIIFSSICISISLLVLAWNGKQYQHYFSIKNVNMLVFMYGLLGMTVGAKALLMILGYESYDVLQGSAVNSLMSALAF